jgi:hypothetical protein
MVLLVPNPLKGVGAGTARHTDELMPFQEQLFCREGVILVSDQRRGHIFLIHNSVVELYMFSPGCQAHPPQR